MRPGSALNGCAPYELVRTMRASIIVMGPLVARLGEATIAMPGGCNIGPRRIDFHIRGLEKLGAAIEIDHGFIKVHSRRPHGAVVPLDYPSVGATENLLMAATAAQRRDRHRERRPRARDRRPLRVPHRAWAPSSRAPARAPSASRAATAARRRPHVIADRIEAGHLPHHGRRDRRRRDACAGWTRCTSSSSSASCAPWASRSRRATGASACARDGPLAPGRHLDAAAPGFATDLQAQMMVLLSLADGTSIVTENVFENRFVVVDELNRLGAGITTSGHHAVVAGPRALTGTRGRGARPARRAPRSSPPGSSPTA